MIYENNTVKKIDTWFLKIHKGNLEKVKEEYKKIQNCICRKGQMWVAICLKMYEKPKGLHYSLVEEL